MKWGFCKSWILVKVFFICTSICVTRGSLSIFQNVVTTNDRVSVCTSQGIGLTSEIQASECVCDLGYGHDSGNAQCQTCLTHEYKDTVASVSCTSCNSNMLTLPGSIDVNFCLCAPGFTHDGVDGCTPCAVNTYKAHYGNDACLVCFDNSVSVAESINQNDCVCKPGYTLDASASDVNLKCIQCDTTSFKSENGMQSCTSCPSNSETLTAGSIQSSACLCSLGYTHDGSDCVPCEQGKFKEIIGDGGCTDCGLLETTDNTGSVSNVACVCVMGAYLSDGNCVQCAYGSYKDVTGPESCTPCSGVSYSDTGASACTNCPSNSRSDYPGFTKTGTINDCICDPGYERDGDVCVPCQTGHFKELHGNDALCSTCASGQYQDATAQTDCENCVDNAISEEGSTHVDQCLCLSGFTLSGESCVPCADGYIKNVDGNGVCDACVRGKYSTSTTQCTDCVPNSYTASVGSYIISQCECVETYEKVSASGEFTCQSCEAGFYCAGENQKEPCISHSTSPASSDEASDCKCIDGYYRTDSNACAECPVEHFCVDEALHHCFANSDSSTGQSQETQCTCNAGYEQKDVS